MNPGPTEASATQDGVTLFFEHVTHVDCGFLDADRGLVGMTWLVDARLTGTPGHDGMLFDFGPAKAMLKREIDARIDHRLLVPEAAPELTRGENTLVFTTRTGERIEYRGPNAAIARFDAAEITPALLETELTQALASRLPANVTRLELHLRAEPIDDPAYTYCHGLKAHHGACQHLAHGHRARLAIAVDGIDSPQHAAAWADQWQDVFIGHREDLHSPASDDRYHFAYHGDGGHFALKLDATRCILIDGPATVENIAAHIARTLAEADPGREFTVRACEGVGKGAIATRRVAAGA